MATQVETILADLQKNRAKKLTPQRQEILKILIESKKPKSAQEVFEKVRKNQPNVARDTVYRNLAMLTEEGLVSQINLQNKAKARFEFIGNAKHYHAICVDCEKIFCIDDVKIPKKINPPAKDQGFQIERYAFEIYGHCSACKN